jgi:hypothetical protein
MELGKCLRGKVLQVHGHWVEGEQKHSMGAHPREAGYGLRWRCSVSRIS